MEGRDNIWFVYNYTVSHKHTTNICCLAGFWTLFYIGKGYVCYTGHPSSIPGSGRFFGEGIDYPLQYSWASLVAQLVKTACNAGDLGLIPGLERSLGGGKGYPFQYSGLKNSMDCIVHGASKSRKPPSNFHFHFLQE